MESTSTKQAAIYARISHDAESDQHGIQDQITECRKLAKTLGYATPEIYYDNDVGASTQTGDKPRVQYDQLLADARAGKISTIFAYSNSRLTRRPRELEDLLDLHRDYGTIIRTVVSGDDNLSTSDGRMVARIKVSVDAAESERIAERQRKTYKNKALRGEPKIQRQRAFGWEKDGITIREDEAKWIRYALARVLEGATITAITREFEQAGVKTAANRSKWGRTALLKIITGWRTAGVRTYREKDEQGRRRDRPLRDEHGELIRGTWEPIITLEEREQALAALKQHSRTMKRQGSWPLSGLLACGVCSRPLYGVVGADGRKARYACTTSHNTVLAQGLEDHVVQMAVKHISEERPDQLQAEPQPWPGEARLAETQQLIGELMDGFNSGQLSAAVAFAQVEKLEKEQAQLRAERTEHLANQPKPRENRADAGLLELLGESLNTNLLSISRSLDSEEKPLRQRLREEQDRLNSQRARGLWEPSFMNLEPGEGYDPEFDIRHAQRGIWARPTVSTDRLNEMLKKHIDRIIVKGALSDGTKLTIEERTEILWRD